MDGRAVVPGVFALVSRAGDDVIFSYLCILSAEQGNNGGWTITTDLLV